MKGTSYWIQDRWQAPMDRRLQPCPALPGRHHADTLAALPRSPKVERSEQWVALGDRETLRDISAPTLPLGVFVGQHPGVKQVSPVALLIPSPPSATGGIPPCCGPQSKAHWVLPDGVLFTWGVPRRRREARMGGAGGGGQSLGRPSQGFAGVIPLVTAKLPWSAPGFL